MTCLTSDNTIVCLAEGEKNSLSIIRATCAMVHPFLQSHQNDSSHVVCIVLYSSVSLADVLVYFDKLNGSSCCIVPYLYTRMSIYCCLSMHMTVTSVLSHLVVRTQCFWKRKEKKIEKKININLAMIASQSLERRFMTPPPSQDLLS